jgi:hypothetical protein
MLHTILFSNDKNIMIVANKGDTAVEIVDKIKSIYSLLPYFLKPGIKTWNQKSLTFENGCRIKTSARTKTPAIGFTIDVLYLDEFAHIPSNIIEPYYTAAFPTVSAIQNSKIIITSTPNGMNLFHKLLMDAERPDGDPLKNNYKAMRVYWYQVPGRFVTYIRLNSHKMYEYGVTKEEIFQLVQDRWSQYTKIEMKYIVDNMKDVIYVYNNDKCSDEEVKKMTFVDKNGHDVPILAISEMTTWKEEAIKDIGGEDAFNQEYGLRFINSSKSLLSEAIIDELLRNKKNYIHEEIPEFDKKLKFSYKDLKWVDDDESFLPLKRKEYKIVIFENDSKDSTRNILIENKKDHYDYIFEDNINIQNRTERIAHCRNQILNHVNTNYCDFDYLLMLDLDDVLASGKLIDTIHSCFLYKADQWDAMFANCSDKYYDIYALRKKKYLSSCCWNNANVMKQQGIPHNDAYTNCIDKYIINYPTDSKLITVISAFGGAGLYKLKSIGDAKYIGVESKHLDQQICEHVPFHQNMINRGCKLYINPKMLIR